MDKDSVSHRQILRASSIIGGASVVNILFGLIRVKAAALLLGPAGVGLIGLLQNLLQTATTLGSLGLGSAGTRQIAEAAACEDPAALPLARRAMFLTAMALALMATLTLFLLRHVFAALLFDDPGLADAIGWLSLGVALSLAVAYQSALLTGFRRIGDVARISVAGSVLTTIVAVAALYLWGEGGLIIFVLATPAASALAGLYYLRRLGRPTLPAVRHSGAIGGQISALLRLGLAFTLGGIALLVGQLAMRIMVQRQLGLDALGQFQAAWFLSITYIGFVLQAMGTDYYPRLTGIIDDKVATNRLVNEQTQVALLLAAPVLLGLLALTPWIIQLLYSSDFGEAVIVLRWQVLGDVLKIASWPMGFILLATGDARSYMLSETLAVSVMVGTTWVLIPIVGLQACGIAVLSMYLVYLPLVHRLARRKTGLRWDAGVISLVWLILGACGATFALAHWNALAGAVAGCAASAGFTILAFARLGDALPGPLQRLSKRWR